MPTGPSPRTRGNRTSASKACMISGSENDRVFPEPVNAMPIMSRPAKLDKFLSRQSKVKTSIISFLLTQLVNPESE